MSTDWRATVATRWQTLPSRERRLVTVGASVVALALLWWVGLAPAWQTVRAAPAQLESLERDWQDMQRLAAEVRELRALPAVPLPQAQAALNAAAQRMGDKLRLSLQGDRAVVDITDIPGDALGEWLAEVRLDARTRVLEAQLGRTPQGEYRGRVVLALAGRP